MDTGMSRRGKLVAVFADEFASDRDIVTVMDILSTARIRGIIGQNADDIAGGYDLINTMAVSYDNQQGWALVPGNKHSVTHWLRVGKRVFGGVIELEDDDVFDPQVIELVRWRDNGGPEFIYRVGLHLTPPNVYKLRLFFGELWVCGACGMLVSGHHVCPYCFYDQTGEEYDEFYVGAIRQRAPEV